MTAAVKLGQYVKLSTRKNKGLICTDVYSVTNSAGFIPSEEYFSKEVFSKELNGYKLVPYGMIAYNPSRINVGSVAVQDKCDLAIVSPLYVVFEVDENSFIPEYVYRFLKSRPGQLQIAFLSSGTVRNNLKFDALCKMDIPHPDLSSQKRVIEALGAVEAQVEGLQTLLMKLDEMVKSRFVEMFGASVDSTPWPVELVGSIADVTVGVVIKPAQYYVDDESEGVRAFRSLNVQPMHVKDDDWVFFSREGHEKNSKSALKASDVLIVRSGYPGTSCVVGNEYEGSNAIDLIIAHPDLMRIDPTYLAAFNNCPIGQHQIQSGIGGAAQQHFNVGRYKTLSIPVPPIELQREFASFIQQVDKSQFAVRRSIEQLELLKAKLEQEYFS